MANDSIGIRKLLQAPETSATVLHAILRDKYGEEAYDWDLLTMLYEVQDDYGVDMSTAAINRWAAIQTVMTSDAFFKRLDAFLAVCNTFTVGEPYFTVFDPATVEEAAWGIAEVSLNREMLTFSPAIRSYLKQITTGDYTDDTLPDLFKVIIAPEDEDTPPSVRVALSSAVRTSNADALQSYLDEQMGDMAYQFNQVPSLALAAKRLINKPESTIVDDL